MTAMFPRVEASCERVKAANASAYVASSRIEHIRAGAKQDSAELEAQLAYGEEMLPILFGDDWRLSTRHPHWPASAIVAGRDRYRVPPLTALLDHPLVYRRRGAKRPLAPANAVIIGRPYNALGSNGEVLESARTEAQWLADKGFGVWVRRDLSAWRPGGTQLVIVKHGLQAAGSGCGFLPIASASAGLVCDEEWLAFSRLRAWEATR